MHILITRTTVLREIEQAFSNYFPYLKIEFYRSAHKIYKSSPESDKLELSFRVGDLNQQLFKGQVQILPDDKVSEVEKEFQDRFGISVQIFRKKKDEWEQSVGTDDFTLQQLNQLGRDSSDEKIISDYEQGFMEPEERPEKLL